MVDDIERIPVTIQAAEIQSNALNRQVGLSFLLKDFEKIFDVYIYSHSERSEAIKMFVMVCTTPFILLSLFGIAGEIEIKDQSFESLVDQFPSFVFFIFSIFGLVGLVPFHRFVAAHSNAYKMIRYMNGYRLFYYQLIEREMDEANWRPAIEMDPRHPMPQLLKPHWTNLFGAAMVILNSSYFCVGIWLWDKQSSLMVLIFATVIMVILHVYFARNEIRAQDIDRLKEQNIDVDEIIKKLNKSE